MENIKLFIFACFSVLAFLSCDPQQDDKISLDLPPDNVSFEIATTSHPNRFILRNTTPGTFISNWDLGNGTTGTGQELEAYFPKKGDYTISLRTFNNGGHGTGTQNINIPEDDPDACASEPFLEFLTNCDSKTWVMNPEPGSFWVGPHDGSSTWWEIDQAAIDERWCAYDDEWIFTPDGIMVYDTKGDIWGEDYLGFDFACSPEADMQPPLDAWGSGTHAFEIIPGTPPQLRLNGTGAFIGLPKAANGAEVTTPQQSVTYDVIEYSNQGDRDYILLRIDMGAGNWEFEIASF